MLARLCLPTLSDFTHVVVVAESCCFLTMHISARTEFSQSLELKCIPVRACCSISSQRLLRLQIPSTTYCSTPLPFDHCTSTSSADPEAYTGSPIPNTSEVPSTCHSALRHLEKYHQTQGACTLSTYTTEPTTLYKSHGDPSCNGNYVREQEYNFRFYKVTEGDG